jgi:hypothetical protein
MPETPVIQAPGTGSALEQYRSPKHSAAAEVPDQELLPLFFGFERRSAVAKRGEEKHVTLVGARVTAEDHEKLLALARQSQRTSADVLRLLIRKAVLPETPAVVVEGPPDAA